jgi:protein kinase A
MKPQKSSGTVYAVKIISKHKVLQTQQQEHLFNEIKYMSKMNHKFICTMRGVAQDSRNIYILMDYLQHGELLNVLTAVGRMPPKLARFYCA